MTYARFTSVALVLLTAAAPALAAAQTTPSGSRRINAPTPQTSSRTSSTPAGDAKQAKPDATKKTPPASGTPQTPTSQTPPRTASPQPPPSTSSTSTPQTTTPAQAGTSVAKPPTPPATLPTGVQTPSNYTIGPDDVLSVLFWREKDLSGDVTVRPDGKISLTLLNDVQAAGLTPEQLRDKVMEAASRYVTDPSVTIVVKTINSRKVYVTGQVNKPGTYPLTDTMTVLQMLALAGGLNDYAKQGEILIMRTEQGQTRSFKFNYGDVRKGKKLQQNITLVPGDTIVVP